MRQVLALVLALFACIAPAGVRAQTAGPLADLQMQLSSMSARAPGHVSAEIKDLNSGSISGINASASMPAASTIKIPIMVEVFRQLAAGNFDFNTAVTLTRSDKDWGSGDLSDAPAGAHYPISQLLTAMITVSDNTAANMLIRLVGRQNINATMLNMGLEHTRIGDYIHTEGNAAHWTLRSSASDMVMLLSQMANEKLIDEWSSRQMIDILSRQKINTLLPQALPPDITIAHKTGSFHDTLNDVGIVFAAQNPYVIAVMTTNLPSLYDGRRFIHSVSRLAYDEIAKLGSLKDGMDMAAPAQTAPAASTDGTSDTPMWGGNSNAPAPEPTGRPRR